MRSSLSRVLALGLVITAPARAQEPVTVSASFDAARWLTPASRLEITLSRKLEPQDGRLALIVGDLDVSGMIALADSVITYEPRTVRLPRGESAVTVYLVKPDDRWEEIARLPLRVLTAGGFEKAELLPKLSLNNKGQVAEGHAPATNRPPRSEFQDFSMNFGFQTMHVARGWQLQSQSNFMGVSNRQEALRFGERGERAARVDLSDYSFTIQRASARVTAGHVSFGNHRLLLNSFQSRGLLTELRIAPGANLRLTGMNSTAVVGWSNFLGLSRSKHRVLAADLTLDLLPDKPGLIQLAASALHGAALPQAGFTQGVVTDAERSRGGGLQLTAALPSQRVRLDAGFARSRFTNPFDPTLARGDSLVPVEPVTRNARYLDLNLALLRAALSPTLPANVALVFRHERVDPLYRSVAMPQLRADILQDAVEMQASLGTAALRVSHTRGHDNLDRIGTILSTQTRAHTANLDVPLSLFFGAAAPAWLPALSFALARTHQFGDSVPRAGGFPDSFVPDQVSLNSTIGAQAQAGWWRVGVRFDRSRQDNRQIGRERADFLNRAYSLSLGLNPATRLDLSVDLALEKATSEERQQENTTRRIGSSLVWRIMSNSTLTGSVTSTRTTDEPRTMNQQANELRIEAAQRLNVFGAHSTRAPGQIFLRYSKLFGEQAGSSSAAFSQRSWLLNTGASLTLF